MPLPPYLTSAASSRAHHALLVKLDEAASPQEQDGIVAAEVERCRALLSASPSTSRIAQTLIILLHCDTVTHTAVDLEFALIPALQLAEGGRTLAERRMGYRYLAEQLPPGHELHLLLVNTVRKDLASEDEGHVLSALTAIVQLPGGDLAPAVLPLLSAKRLLEHERPEIRQRCVQALCALQPLGPRELARRMRHERDPGVLASVFGAFALVLNTEDDPAKRRKQVDSVFAAAERNVMGGTTLLTRIIRVLVAMVRRETDDVLERSRRMFELIAERVTAEPSPCLLEACALVSALHDAGGAGSGGDVVLAHIRRQLKGKTLDPNAHVTVIKCLRSLPLPLWMDGLDESHMAAIMRGLQSEDGTVRRETLRLLCVVDRAIVDEAFAVCLGTSQRPITQGNAERALEIVQVDAEGLPPDTRGWKLALGVRRIATAVGDEVWIHGVQAVLSDLHAIPPIRASFIDTLAEGVGNPTLAVLLASAATEYRVAGDNVVNALLDALPSLPSSVQEIVVISLVPLWSSGSRAIQVLDALKAAADAHIAKRCDEVRVVLDSGRTDEVVSRAKTRSLNDVLDVILEVNAELRRPETSIPTSPAPLSQSELKYSYEAAPKQRAMGRSMLVENE